MFIESYTLMKWLSLAGFNIREDQLKNKKESSENIKLINPFFSHYFSAVFR